MMKSLSLLAVLALSAICVAPSSAHAACSMSTLYSYSSTWLRAQFGGQLSCQPGSNCNTGPVGNGCASPAQNYHCQQCSEPGVTGWWDWLDNKSCDAWLPMDIHGTIVYRPNPTYYTYNYRCQCSESVYTCAWE